VGRRISILSWDLDTWTVGRLDLRPEVDRECWFWPRISPENFEKSKSVCETDTPVTTCRLFGFCHGEMIRSHSGYLLLLALLQRYVVGFMSAKSEPAVNPMRGVCILCFRYMRSLIIVRVVVAAVVYFSPAARLSGRVKSWLSAWSVRFSWWLVV
jgi:hypothetical protein